MFVVLVARVAMTTIANARAEFTIVKQFFRRYFPLFHALFTENLRHNSKF